MLMKVYLTGFKKSILYGLDPVLFSLFLVQAIPEIWNVYRECIQCLRQEKTFVLKNCIDRPSCGQRQQGIHISKSIVDKDNRTQASNPKNVA